MQRSRDLVDRASELHLGEIKRKSALRWSALNICILAILILDIYKTSKYYDPFFYYLEVAACIILGLSLLKNLLTYLYYTFFVGLVTCENEDQRLLLNLNTSNSIVKSKMQVETIKKQDTEETIWGSVRNLSWQNWSDCNCKFLSFLNFILLMRISFSELIKFKRTKNLERNVEFELIASGQRPELQFHIAWKIQQIGTHNGHEENARLSHGRSRAGEQRREGG